MAENTEESPMHLSEQVLHCTARIIVKRHPPDTDGIGTGFFFNFLVDGNSLPLLITNRHVVEQASAYIVRMSGTAADGRPAYGEIAQDIVYDNPAAQTFIHPEPAIDLAAIIVAPLISKFLEHTGVRPFFRHFSEEQTAGREELEALRAIESVVMIGYPQGHWDEVNNLPIARRGITATPPWMNHRGDPWFCIDMPIYDGSSGSPIFLMDEGVWSDRRGQQKMGGTRIKLLGVLWGGPRFDAQGRLEAAPIESAATVVPVLKPRYDIGYVVPAYRIFDFLPLITERHEQEQEQRDSGGI